ncbi:hypothetical protein J5289_13725 [Rhizobium sp. B230/85]|nr:hypothetical protein [Rhizobium sp. L58/93]MBO9132223.1 hypothetical protein [Rhizobium sp. B209b/85]MBO9169233.1 hypothetical protein [Rhizobium sp. L245/93]MBO9185183.1 hypothetical protein [Rhizobium sp. E27B/91]QXZ85805.1 hypothetical protein J5287_07405 [Rhizobium sp. K1/93]QXZ91768.1 hypothetical protein J5280_02595 [Rhizobium sp. K15/93]QXZ97881.1 hypothetical protein J5289_13725 [Rhizobium sp. B230/85]QYA03359.1 hypothetical protein J5278_07855 [Rhizobium sp. B21/90]
MMNLFAKLGTASLIALSAVSVMAPSVSAAGLSSPAETVRYQHHGRDICSPLMAVRKARAAGIRRAEIAKITPRRVVVVGRSHHGMERMVFANQSDCPVLRR